MGKHCPVCSDPVIVPFGDTDSDILIVGSVPSDDELESGRGFSDPVFSILKKDLFKAAGIDMNAVRKGYVWFHGKQSRKGCLEVSSSLVIEELKGKKVVVLVGADAVSFFSDLSVEDTNGLDVTDEVASRFDIDEGARFFALCSPTNVYRYVGEYRFGLSKLGEWMKHG